MKILVVGSLNLDRFSVVHRLPKAGETVAGVRSFSRYGGKGANQAMAVARLGGHAALIGAVGSDEVGRAYRRRLTEAGVDASCVFEKDEGVETGTAAIAVEGGGENSIIVHPNANGLLSADDLKRASSVFEGSEVLLVQFEVPDATVCEAIRLANQMGIKVVLNPSPWRPGFDWNGVKLHTVIVNESETNAWLGTPRFPSELNVERVIVTRGHRPTMVFTSAACIEVPPPRVRPIDTVGAGDAFAGAYAVALSESLSLVEAVRFATAAGALTTLREGAQEALPDRAAVLTTSAS